MLLNDCIHKVTYALLVVATLSDVMKTQDNEPQEEYDYYDEDDMPTTTTEEEYYDEDYPAAVTDDVTRPEKHDTKVNETEHTTNSVIANIRTTARGTSTITLVTQNTQQDKTRHNKSQVTRQDTTSSETTPATVMTEAPFTHATTGCETTPVTGMTEVPLTQATTGCETTPVTGMTEVPLTQATTGCETTPVTGMTEVPLTQATTGCETTMTEAPCAYGTTSGEPPTFPNRTRASSRRDYCSFECVGRFDGLARKHVLCEYPQDRLGPECGQYNAAELPLTDHEEQLLVDQHNTLRSHVAQGSELRGSPGPQPPAARMGTIMWDAELALIAQRWAMQCEANDEIENCRDLWEYKVGQNVKLSCDPESTVNTMSAQLESTVNTVSAQLESTVNTVLAQLESTVNTVSAQLESTVTTVSAQLESTTRTTTVTAGPESTAETVIEAPEHRVRSPSRRRIRSIEDQLRAWYGEVSDVVASQRNRNDPSNRATRHYRQMVWDTTTRLGCARMLFTAPKRCELLVCMYAPAVAEHGGEAVYEVGHPCSNCHGSCSIRFPGLCTKIGDEPNLPLRARAWDTDVVYDDGTRSVPPTATSLVAVFIAIVLP